MERAAWVRSGQSRGPLAGAVGAMRRLGREVAGPVSDGGRGEGLRGAGAQVAPSPCPAFLRGDLAPQPLTRSPGVPSHHHLGQPPAQPPPKLPRSPWPSSQACSPHPHPDLGCHPGPTLQSPPWSRPGPPSPPPSGPSTPVLTISPGPVPPLGSHPSALGSPRPTPSSGSPQTVV